MTTACLIGIRSPLTLSFILSLLMVFLSTTKSLNNPFLGIRSPLTLSFDELADIIGGTGRAKLFWDSIRQGLDPLDIQDIEGSQGLSIKARKMLTEHWGDALVPTTVALESTSPCGTVKLLQRLNDGQSVESVLIPSLNNDRTTLCVSTQIGCDRGCLFCATGKMGLVRNLTADEIVGQVVQGLYYVRKYADMPPLTNIVLMGMGDAARNSDAVGKAVDTLVDRNRLSMAASKVTISTVGPSPDMFSVLAAMPGTLAWSLHSADNGIRKLLVPSTQHSVEELRCGLIAALKTRAARRQRSVMIAVTLVDDINDSLEDAEKLADFLLPMLEVGKITVDLIPYNDINVPGFRKPRPDKVQAFQQYLRKQRQLVCSIRITRGDADFMACGMLSTKRTKKISLSVDQSHV